MATLTLRLQPPEKFLKALQEAEALFATTVPSGSRSVNIPLATIKEKPVLFQPREINYGSKPVDTDHVSKLIGEIGIKGTLDPILVIKLGEDWVCVDGHHRLEAYRQSYSPKKLIRCECFQGRSVQEAIYEALRRNAYQHLPLSNSDRQEAAWRYVIIGRGSARKISKTCGVSERQVFLMRRVKASWDEKSPVGIRMNQKAPEGPHSVCWYKARAYYNDQDVKEVDHEEEAQRLARFLHSRLDSRLQGDLSISTRALEIHCPDLVSHIRKEAQEALKPFEERFAL